MSNLQDYENEKRERRRLRGQQRSLIRAYIKAVQTQNSSLIETLKDDFLEKFDVEKRVDAYMGVEPAHYPIFFDNVFKALGFGIYRGMMPTVSGIQPDQPFHVAFDASRMILIRGFPSSLFAEIADVQPLANKPILGVGHTTWVRINKRDFDDWEQKYVQVSTALGIGRLQISSPDILKSGIELDPQQDTEKFQQIAKQIGLVDFLSLPVDNLPLYGSFRIGERNKIFDKKNVKKMLFSSIERGHRLAIGAITSFDPLKALENPNLLIRQLDKSDLIEETDQIRITPTGERYVSEKLVGTAQEAALLKTADLSIFENLRSEFHTLERKLDDSISNSKQEILNAINEVKLQIKETGTKHNISAKYVIETPPASPIKLHVEIPIGEIAEEDIYLKIAEIKAKVQTLPFYLVAELKKSLKSLPKIPRHVKELLLRTLQSEEGSISN
jgi:hypothetical protein